MATQEPEKGNTRSDLCLPETSQVRLVFGNTEKSEVREAFFHANGFHAPTPNMKLAPSKETALL
jgi:hypothetical protein